VNCFSYFIENHHYKKNFHLYFSGKTNGGNPVKKHVITTEKRYNIWQESGKNDKIFI